MFDYFEQWDKRSEDGHNPFQTEQGLVQYGQWEGAWALAQLHHDQLAKHEAKNGIRQHKGHPLCNLALIGRVIGSQSLTRHYAMLSSAGDVYWEHKDPGLKFGGLAPTLLERFESHHKWSCWQDRLRRQSTLFGDKPVYLESLLAARWFTETYAEHITSLAEIKHNYGKSFTEVLLDAVENSKNSKKEAPITGTRFEAAAGLLLSATPGFEVDCGRGHPGTPRVIRHPAAIASATRKLQWVKSWDIALDSCLGTDTATEPRYGKECMGRCARTPHLTRRSHHGRRR